MKLRHIYDRLIHLTSPDVWYSKFELSVICHCSRSSISPTLSALRRSGFSILMRWDHEFRIYEYNISRTSNK